MSDLKSTLANAGLSMGGGGGGGGGGNEEDAKRAAAEEQRRSILSAILTPEARERLNRVSLVKPDNARAEENHLLSLARGNKLGGARVDEEMVIKFLEQVGGGKGPDAAPPSRVIVMRKKGKADSDDEEF